MMNKQQQQQQPPTLMSLNNLYLMNMNQPQPQMLPLRGGLWPPPSHFRSSKPTAGVMPGFEKPLGPRSNWKGKMAGNSNLNDIRRIEQQNIAGVVGSGGIMMGVGGGVGNSSSFTNYQPPNLNELQHRNRLKMRKFFPKKRFNKSGGVGMDMENHNDFYHSSSGSSRSAPYAPRNTTSFIIRAKKSGGIASLVSPSPGTPAILPSPFFSPSREVLVDMAKEEWGVDGYGSMKGLIRLRSPGHENEEDEGGSSEIDVEEHVELEKRLDHDLSRFEMIYNPNSNNHSTMEYHNVLENRIDDQDSHIAQLEEENLILKERLFLMESELGNLRRRMQFLEGKQNKGEGEEMNEEVMENDSDSESRETHRHEQEFSDDKAHLDVSSLGRDADNFNVIAVTEKNGVAEVDEINNLGALEGSGTNIEIELVGADNTAGLSKHEDENESKFDFPAQGMVKDYSME